MLHRRTVSALAAVTALAVPLALFSEERVDLYAINRIRTEAIQNSKVMDHMFYLTDVNGPRLTNSPNFFASADWVVSRMKEYGITAKEEKWGPPGTGWQFKKFYAAMTAPQYQPLVGFPLAWSPGTNGPISADAVYAPLSSEADFAKFKGKLKGKIVLATEPRTIALAKDPLSKRYTDAELAEQATVLNQDRDPEANYRSRLPAAWARLSMAEVRELRKKINQFLVNEGVAVVLSYGYAGDSGTVFGSSAGSRDPKEPPAPASVVVTPEHYNRIYRLLDHNIPVKLDFDVQAETPAPRESVNVIAEIPGDKKKDEIVMLGAHLDSWQGGTGATDNAAGSAVMIEAMRILKTLNLKTDRTIRMALWGGEEQGLLGSKAYVKEHFADPETMKVTSEHARLAGYFNLDNGSGKIRGVYLQSNDMVRPIFEEWLAPFKDMGATSLTIRDTSGTDHLSFDAVGLPGFQFIQDPLEYGTRTHHSNMDVYDHISKNDLMQASAIIAAFVYNTANRSEVLPRKPLPPPKPKSKDGESKPDGKAQRPAA